MTGVAFTPKTIATAYNANERTQRIWGYLKNRPNAERLKTGKEMLVTYKTFLGKIERDTGIPPEVILTFWGAETDYGRNKGQDDIFQAMAALAYEGSRRDFYEANLIAGMKIMQRTGFSKAKMVGSWAGAVGHAQFMPTAYLQYAVDGEGDGVIDLWDSVEDAFASKANYLKLNNAKSPWVRGQAWIAEVQPPAGFSYADADLMIKKPLSAWTSQGVTLMGGSKLTALRGADDATPAAVFAPGGKSGPTVITLPNFDRFVDYNPSQSYALSIALWSNAIAGRPGLAVPWPVDEPDITRAQAYALQKKLKALGFSDAEPDGDIGKGTRAAIRSYQLKNGMIADGFPSCAIVKKVLAE
ncbi:Tn3 family transposase TnXax1 [Alphaproteobacteria bacterium SO-S41]|nr:Tn3 family transposase TnXax1 [Alphaproteobacteria bacterium SO-S41]